MSRVFLTSIAQYYKRDKPHHESDAEVLNPLFGYVECLDEIPISREELHNRMIKKQVDDFNKPAETKEKSDVSDIDG